MVPANFMSVYVAENALGCETVYGTASALGQIASFVAAMCFGAIYNNLKRFTYIIIILPIIAAVVLVLDIIYMFWHRKQPLWILPGFLHLKQTKKAPCSRQKPAAWRIFMIAVPRT